MGPQNLFWLKHDCWNTVHGGPQYLPHELPWKIHDTLFTILVTKKIDLFLLPLLFCSFTWCSLCAHNSLVFLILLDLQHLWVHRLRVHQLQRLQCQILWSWCTTCQTEWLTWLGERSHTLSCLALLGPRAVQQDYLWYNPAKAQTLHNGATQVVVIRRVDESPNHVMVCLVSTLLKLLFNWKWDNQLRPGGEQFLPGQPVPWAQEKWFFDCLLHVWSQCLSHFSPLLSLALSLSIYISRSLSLSLYQTIGQNRQSQSNPHQVRQDDSSVTRVLAHHSLLCCGQTLTMLRGLYVICDCSKDQSSPGWFLVCEHTAQFIPSVWGFCEPKWPPWRLWFCLLNLPSDVAHFVTKCREVLLIFWGTLIELFLVSAIEWQGKGLLSSLWGSWLSIDRGSPSSCSSWVLIHHFLDIFISGIQQDILNFSFCHEFQ